MSKITTRTRIVIISLFAGIVYFLGQFLDWSSILNIPPGFAMSVLNAVIVGLVICLGTLWALFGKVRGERIVSILLFPAVSLVVLSLVVEIIVTSIFSDSSRVFVYLFSTVLISSYAYITILTANILNASYLGKVPLGQAGKASLFILTLITSYLFYLVLFTSDTNLFVRMGILFVSTLFLVYQCLWSLKIEVRKRTLSTFVITLTILIFGMVISFWPMLSPYLALAMSLMLYLLLNIAMEERELVDTWMWVEYLAVFFLIAALMVIFSEWGINGPLI